MDIAWTQSLTDEKIANNFAPRDCLQKFAGFSHGLGGDLPIARHLE
jgi:hypothetical protein